MIFIDHRNVLIARINIYNVWDLDRVNETLEFQVSTIKTFCTLKHGFKDTMTPGYSKDRTILCNPRKQTRVNHQWMQDTGHDVDGEHYNPWLA